MMQRNIFSILGLMLFAMATVLMATSECPSTSQIVILADENPMELVVQEVIVTSTGEHYALSSNEMIKAITLIDASGGPALFAEPGHLVLNRGRGLWYRIDRTWPRFVLVSRENENIITDYVWSSSEMLQNSISTRD